MGCVGPGDGIGLASRVNLACTLTVQQSIKINSISKKLLELQETDRLSARNFPGGSSSSPRFQIHGRVRLILIFSNTNIQGPRTS